MANHKSAIKRHRQSLKNNERNKSAKSKMRRAIKNFKEAVSSSVALEELQKKFSTVQKIIASTAGKGVLAKKTGARYISRLSKMISKAASQDNK